MKEQTNTNGALAVVSPQTSEAIAQAQEFGGLVSPFANPRSFEAAQRMAKALSSSSMVPQQYRGDQGVANCLIAMEVASRIGVSVMATMQNLHIIQGKPSWSSSFLIASVNASGRFTPLRFEWSGTPGKPDWACRARATCKEDSELCVGSWITWTMVEKEGWSKKSGSKWLTMPEQMFVYRAAAFWQRSFCPEISLGFRTSDEAIDVHGEEVGRSTALPHELTPSGAASLKAVLGLQKSAAEAPDHDPNTGEVIDDEPPMGALSTDPKQGDEA